MGIEIEDRYKQNIGSHKLQEHVVLEFHILRFSHRQRGNKDQGNTEKDKPGSYMDKRNEDLGFHQEIEVNLM